MPKNDGFATDKARETHNTILQCEQLRSIAKVGTGVLGSHIIDALNEAATSIEKLAFDSTSTRAQVALDTLLANVDNQKLSDKEFREFIRNTWVNKELNTTK